jgi:hypothetical protein
MMASLKNRIKRLEVFKSDDGLRVIIYRWGGSSKYEELGRVTCGDLVIERTAMETEDDFMSRADDVLRQLANSSQKLITAWADFTWQKKNT